MSAHDLQETLPELEVGVAIPPVHLQALAAVADRLVPEEEVCVDEARQPIRDEKVPGVDEEVPGHAAAEGEHELVPFHGRIGARPETLDADDVVSHERESARGEGLL